MNWYWGYFFLVIFVYPSIRFQALYYIWHRFGQVFSISYSSYTSCCLGFNWHTSFHGSFILHCKCNDARILYQLRTIFLFCYIIISKKITGKKCWMLYACIYINQMDKLMLLFQTILVLRHCIYTSIPILWFLKY